jgi:hypothetical protein
MFQLFKVRNFNSLINDTFTFFKVCGKNYFKNYLIINGGLLLVIAVLGFIIGKVFLENFFAGVASGDPSQMFGAEFEENLGLIITLSILAGILLLIISIINYSYPVVYLTLFEKNKKPDAKEIFNGIKSKIGRIILFGLLSLVTFLPLFIPVALLGVLLFVIIIGIPGTLILLAAYSSWIYLTFYDYLNTKDGFFTSMGRSWNILTKNFWPNVGSTAIFYAIMYVAQMIIWFITFLMEGIGGLMSADPQMQTDPTEVLTVVGIIALIGFLIYTVFAFLVGNLLIINQGMIYYSAREEEENNSLKTDIDLIGSDIE